jgi:hypothetical protein
MIHIGQDTSLNGIIQDRQWQGSLKEIFNKISNLVNAKGQPHNNDHHGTHQESKVLDQTKGEGHQP